MTIAAEFETTIGRSSDAVFRELAALERYPEWLVASGVVAVERFESPEPGGPTHLRIEQRVAGRAAVLEGIVTVFEPGRRLAFGASDRDGIRIEADAQLAADGPLTRLRWSLRLTLPLRYRFFESMAAPRVREAAAADLERLRTRLESVAG